ncbi:MAG: hypothetical protein IJE08_01000 [Clostridia bacterium]|nr:hypothetical protein [Clostridia bacterium]
MMKILMDILLMMFFLTPAALAEEAGAVQAYTWETLGTMAGATAATLMIVQLIKAPLDRVWKLPTRMVVYFVALILLLAAQGFSGGLTVQTAALSAVNAVMVALSAYGSYEVAFGGK